MFKKILIANRGEIACRVAASAKKLGIRTVAVYSDADKHAKHVSFCDEAVHIGGSSPKDSYLKGDVILAVAKQTRCEAIHPGYGFLSENDQFAHACKEAGIVFIGPPAEAITAMGLKAESKRLMENAGVPLIPGYHGDNQDPAFLHAQAERIGYPLLIKASSGGGGKGMRLVERSEDFVDALTSCQREAKNSFGNDSVLLEKYATRPRHIEIQIFGDTHGNYVYLFERDCSVQRRHQKVLEEAPAPFVDEAMRERMGQAAINAARAVGYVGAGTVEFIVEQTDHGMSFYFMEMNTRLQVEHPVTEAITGTDLVAWQLIVAAGGKLPKTQDELSMTGHAIEARICAENPDNQFLPATGTLKVYQKPNHTAFELAQVRIDDGVREGDTISPYYDSMIAKLIVHADTREAALALLDQALQQLCIVGLPNNVAFLRRVLATPSFAKPDLDTALIQREKERLFDQSIDTPWLLAGAVAGILSQENKQSLDPFASHDGFRAYTPYQRRFEFLHQETPIQATLSLGDNGYVLGLPEGDFDFEYDGQDPQKPTVAVWLNGKRQAVQVWQLDQEIFVFWQDGNGFVSLITHSSTNEESAAGSLKSPMPGQVVAFRVAVGDTVKKGQALAVIEAMKMEHTINAPTDGVVQELLFAVGDLVADGDELLRLEEA